jgi:hypothetical protein
MLGFIMAASVHHNEPDALDEFNAPAVGTPIDRNASQPDQ